MPGVIEKMGVREQSVEAVVRGPDKKIKDYRFVQAYGPFTFEFLPNERFISLLNKGYTPWKIPILRGRWLIQRNKK